MQQQQQQQQQQRQQRQQRVPAGNSRPPPVRCCLRSSTVQNLRAQPSTRQRNTCSGAWKGLSFHPTLRGGSVKASRVGLAGAAGGTPARVKARNNTHLPICKLDAADRFAARWREQLTGCHPADPAAQPAAATDGRQAACAAKKQPLPNNRRAARNKGLAAAHRQATRGLRCKEAVVCLANVQLQQSAGGQRGVALRCAGEGGSAWGLEHCWRGEGREAVLWGSGTAGEEPHSSPTPCRS